MRRSIGTLEKDKGGSMKRSVGTLERKREGP